MKPKQQEQRAYKKWRVIDNFLAGAGVSVTPVMQVNL
jgi:hypothetical protein